MPRAKKRADSRRWMRHSKTGVMFEWTRELEKMNPLLIHCDADGNPVGWQTVKNAGSEVEADILPEIEGV